MLTICTYNGMMYSCQGNTQTFKSLQRILEVFGNIFYLLDNDIVKRYNEKANIRSCVLIYMCKKKETSSNKVLLTL